MLQTAILATQMFNLNVQNSSLFTLLFLLLLIILAFVPIFMGLYLYGRMKNLSIALLTALRHCEFRINQVDGCQMENMKILRTLVKEEGYSKLSETFSEFERDSFKLFHGKWTTDLRKYIDREHLLTQSQYQSLASDKAFQVLSIGLLSTAFALIFTLTLAKEMQNVLLPFTLLPALTASLMCFVLYYTASRYRLELDQSMRLFAETASLRIPVFSDLAGSAVLVEAFMQYDRKMEQSVNRLSSTVSQLLNQEMVKAVSAAVYESVNASLLPSLEQSQQQLQQLIAHIHQRQETGMKELAEQFIDKSTALLTKRMETFFMELDQYLHQLRDTRGELALALQSFEQYQKMANHLDESLNEHLNHLKQLNISHQNIMLAKQEAEAQLSKTCQELVKLQGGTEESLRAVVLDVSKQVSSFANQMSRLVADMSVSNDVTQGNMQTLLNSQDKSIGNYQQLAQNLVEASNQLNQQFDFFSREIANFNQNLVQSSRNFNRELVESLNQVLQTMDGQLAEVSQRLSQSVVEIKDCLHDLPKVLQQAAVDPTAYAQPHFPPALTVPEDLDRA